MADEVDDEGVKFAKYYAEKLKKEIEPNKRVRLLRKIRSLNVSLEVLQASGIIKLVSSLRKCDGEVGNSANEIVARWKHIAKKTEKPNVETQSVICKNRGNGTANWSSRSSPNSSPVDTDCDKRVSNKSDQSWKSLKDDIHVGASHSKKRTNINCSSFAEGDHGRTSVHGKHDKETAKPICFSSERVKSDSLISSKLKNSSDAFGAHHVSSHKHTTVTKRKRIENPSGTSTIAGTKRSKKYLNEDSGGGFNASIASFEDALGFNDKPSVKKKKTNVPVNKVKKIEVPLCTVEKEVKSTSSIMPFNDFNVTSTLSEIQPFYKPLRYNIMDSPSKKKHSTSQEFDKGVFVTSRHNRTQVFSGRRTQCLAEVPTLYNACIKVLQEHVNGLSWLDGVPYSLLKPVLERCSPELLYNLEDFNPYLLEDSDELWAKHCESKFKGQARQELETWRDLYLRLQDEREAKLKCVTANISASMAKAVPIRKTKLAYVDCDAKPPRNVARKQAKFGTGMALSMTNAVQKNSSIKPVTRPSLNSNAGSTAEPVPPPPPPPAVQQKVVKKIAPLMQKTIKFMKNRFRR